ncbi:MOSC domain-containing protein [Rubrobacter marinus]|nr:MOSC domain-containing protein [Rubrobacter marinus]
MGNSKPNDRAAASLTTCVAHVLGVDPSGVPDDGGVGLRQWLAGRELGLVPVRSPESFEWPGRFLGLPRGSSGWAVFFGVPPGVVFAPSGAPDATANPVLEAAYVLAEHDPARGIEPGGGGAGTVELISLAAEAEGPMTVTRSAEAVAGRGLRGDRYERGAGTFSNPDGRGYDLTLVEAEALEDLAASGVELAPAEARRNLVVRGIELDALIGRRFRVGEVECFGQRRCEPCAHLEGLTRPGVLRGLVHRGGLRADVLSGGEIRLGDPVEAL